MSRLHHRTAVLLTGLATATTVTLVGAPVASAALPEITSGDHYRITGGSSPTSNPPPPPTMPGWCSVRSTSRARARPGEH
jgi:hypothetical protein